LKFPAGCEVANQRLTGLQYGGYNFPHNKKQLTIILPVVMIRSSLRAAEKTNKPL
jgi:hypothetical protein